jgi:hypothetical protein
MRTGGKGIHHRHPPMCFLGIALPHINFKYSRALGVNLH